MQRTASASTTRTDCHQQTDALSIPQCFLLPPKELQCCFLVRHANTVEGALTAMLGMAPSQRLLLAFRASVFNGFLPRPNRDEKRNRRCNIATFEAYRTTILFLLSRPDVYAQILAISLGNCNCLSEEKILMHIFDI
jgi:hypothetical protein